MAEKEKSKVTQAVELIWENELAAMIPGCQEFTTLLESELISIVRAVESNNRYQAIVKKSPATAALVIETKIKERREHNQGQERQTRPL